MVTTPSLIYVERKDIRLAGALNDVQGSSGNTALPLRMKVD
jgi:hypothetical protein